jgi:hypothetical protein
MKAAAKVAAKSKKAAATKKAAVAATAATKKPVAKPVTRAWELTEDGRERIATAQRKRWARFHRQRAAEQREKQGK